MGDATPECWVAIPEYVGFYEASDLGRIRSVPRKWCRGTVLKAQANPYGGHLQVGLSRNGVIRIHYVHQLVAAAFFGPRPEGLETRHLDGNPANNTPGNLVYGTHTENAQDMVRHGTSIAGTRHPFTTLTDADVAAIRLARQQGARGVDLAARYGVSPASICRIVKGNTFTAGEVLPLPPGTCHYPDCDRPAEAGTNSQGLPKVYCPDPEHGNITAKMERKRRRTAEMRSTATCPHCGTAFPLTRSDKIYCTRECKTLAFIAAVSERKQQQARRLACEWCGKSFTTTRRDRRFCTTACQELARARRRERSRSRF